MPVLKVTCTYSCFDAQKIFWKKTQPDATVVNIYGSPQPGRLVMLWLYVFLTPLQATAETTCKRQFFK